MSVLTTIARGDGSHVTEPRRVICRTQEEWRTLWAAHAGPAADAPEVDLTSMIVAAAFAGEKPSAGHSIEISAAEQPGPGVRLVVDERRAGAGVVLAQIITSPFHIVAVAKGVGDVAWAEDRGSRTEDGRSASSDLDPRSAILERPSSTGLQPSTASALAYVAGPFSGALILLAESTNQDVRFHAWQSIVGLGGLGLAVIASYALALVAVFVSATAVALMLGVATVIWIVLAIVWAICIWKAWSGERWTLPLAGDYAERLVIRAAPGARS
jgi:uncharacterized membrane protein